MRISSKGCYAVAALTEMALEESGERVTVAAIAKRLGISKIYLEQVFAILRRGGIVVSTKGAQGGYTLGKSPDATTMYDILAPIEALLFEDPRRSMENIPMVAGEVLCKLIFVPLDDAIIATLKVVTLADLAAEVRTKRGDESMYYI